MTTVAILSKETPKQGRAKEAAAVAKAKAEGEDEKVAWITMTAFEKTLTWSPQALFPPSLFPTTSDDIFCDMMSEDSDQGHETPGMEETHDKESGCENEEESDDQSVGEEKEVSMPQLMDLSESEDSKDEYEPTSIYTPGSEAYITTFGSAAPSWYYAIPVPLPLEAQRL